MIRDLRRRAYKKTLMLVIARTEQHQRVIEVITIVIIHFLSTHTVITVLSGSTTLESVTDFDCHESSRFKYQVSGIKTPGYATAPCHIAEIFRPLLPGSRHR